MSTKKFVTMLAVMALSATMAVAQPAPDGGTSVSHQKKVSTMHGKRGQDGGARHRGAGPFIKIGLAKRLESLTADQKTKIDEFVQENKAEAETLQKEFRQAMKDARDATDRNARRAAMKDVREKFKTSEEKVDAFLKGLLTEEQQTEMKSKTSGLRERAANRVRKARAGDSRTTGAQEGKRKEWRKHDRKAGGKSDGAKAGKKRWEKKNKTTGATPAANNAVTSSTAPSPFVQE